MLVDLAENGFWFGIICQVSLSCFAFVPIAFAMVPIGFVVFAVVVGLHPTRRSLMLIFFFVVAFRVQVAKFAAIAALFEPRVVGVVVFVGGLASFVALLRALLMSIASIFALVLINLCIFFSN